MSFKTKYEIGQAFVYKGRNTLFVIENVTFVPKKGILYTVKYVGERPDGKGPFGRYYEERIDSDCIKIENKDTTKLLYA